ncbi:cardiolipin synthase [Aquibacillus koreensis]|uniref:Cardiolipin synthase n=1 Tax=Aquibacillus koreensis TaxID=279446 RepID=A0A9X3WJC3_9BACI|nr:cardiolipin synthase [Aquibacillus koreensis]MCT2538229.1 cardiolipin synthase [Aquibacillus koreensis]MDC3420827.1 cardiolipin synthase [Aquibacillus koreensis]
MNILPYILGFILCFNILLALAIVFLERKNATATWAWLMVLLFIPVVGFVLYLIFGRKLSNKTIFTWDTKSRLGVKKAVQMQLRAIENGTLQIKEPNLNKYKDLFYLHLRNDDAILTQDNEVELFTDGQKKFHALMTDLEQATDHIHLLYYIVRNDQLGERIAEILIKKAKEGVQVRVLFDDMGSRRLKKKFIKKIRNAGAEVESFFPPLIPKLNLKINHRNHRKLAIIDGKVGYIGGFNIGDEYLGFDHRFGYWRDTHLRVKGSAVHHMQTRFILDWNQASRNDIFYDERYYAAEPSGDVGMQIVSSGPDSEWEQIKNGYIKMIMEAEEYVYIQTPYFIPDESLADALKIASLSGVDVRIMIPNKPDHPFVYWATYSYIGELLKAGASAYIYQNGFLHAKTIVVDGKIASVGTANIDVRSFRLNFEVNAFLYSEKLANDLVKEFKTDIMYSSQLTLPLYKQRSLMIRFKESVSRLISPIL